MTWHSKGLLTNNFCHAYSLTDFVRLEPQPPPPPTQPVLNRQYQNDDRIPTKIK